MTVEEEQAQARARVAASLASVATEAWSQSRQLIAAEGTDAFGILALNVAAIVGLGSIAAARDWPFHWWWGLTGFLLSSGACTLLPRVFAPAEGLPNLSDLFGQALAELPNEAAAQTQVARRIQAVAAANLAIATRRRGFNTVALGIMVLSAIFEVLLFLRDFH